MLRIAWQFRLHTAVCILLTQNRKLVPFEYSLPFRKVFERVQRKLFSKSFLCFFINLSAAEDVDGGIADEDIVHRHLDAAAADHADHGELFKAVGLQEGIGEHGGADEEGRRRVERSHRAFRLPFDARYRARRRRSRRRLGIA